MVFSSLVLLLKLHFHSLTPHLWVAEELESQKAEITCGEKNINSNSNGFKNRIVQKKRVIHMQKILTEEPMTQLWPHHAQPLPLAQDQCHAYSTTMNLFSLEKSPFPHPQQPHVKITPGL